MGAGEGGVKGGVEGVGKREAGMGRGVLGISFLQASSVGLQVDKTA